LGERSVEARSRFKRVVAIVHPEGDTLKHNRYGLSKPSVSATISEIGQARDRFLVEVFSCFWDGAIGCVGCSELVKHGVHRTTIRCTRNSGLYSEKAS
jgi:hypothetical protein